MNIRFFIAFVRDTLILAMSDPLSAALEELGVRTVKYERFARKAPWSFEYPAEGRGVHFIERGRARLRIGTRTLTLGAGDAVLLLSGRKHRLEAAAHPAPSEATVITCGIFEFLAPDHPMLEALPEVIYVPEEAARRSPQWQGCLHQLRTELDAERPGRDAVLAALSIVLLTEALRHHVTGSTECPRGAFVRALSDAPLAKALRAFHADLSAEWSVAALAGIAGMSRSSFALRFHQVLGEGVMSYVRRWRMFRARALLREGAHAVEEIATRTGYRSGAAFSAVFRKQHGVTPSAFRRPGSRST